MPHAKSSGCDEPECFKYDERVFGVRKPNKALLDQWKTKGWLSENGICMFPRDVQAYPSGVITSFPIKWWKTASPKEINAALKSGAVKFVDGNGKRYTLDEYNQEYPDFPDPELVLRIEGRFPPDPGRYVDLDDPDERMGYEIKWFHAKM